MGNRMSSSQSNRFKDSFLGIFFQTVKEHPFIFTAILCFFCISLTTGSQISFINSLVPTIAIFLLGVCAAVYISVSDIKKNQKLYAVLMIIGAAVVSFVFWRFVFVSDEVPYRLLNFGLLVIVGIFMYLALTDRLTYDKVLLLILAAGFLVRLVYVMYTPVTERQHDVNTFGKGKGHSGYIEYIYNNWNVPDMDVRKISQFYHPPMHHILAAIWLRIQTTLGIAYKNACENIQILTLFYSSICMILSYKIFRALNLRKAALNVAVAIIAFCPTFFIMAGSINNDILSITFMLGAVLNTIYWYRNQKFRHIIAIAFCVGFGMMTKLSVWMITPAIAFVFIYVFFKNLKNFKKYLLQFVVFGVICVPLGLWWAVRNFVKYGVPLTYVPMLSLTSRQYIGDIPFTQRLFDFSLFQFSDVGDQFTIYGGAYNEYNPTIALFKTSVFDELITVSNYPKIAVFNKILFWSAVAVALIGFVTMIIMLIKKNKELDMPMKIFIFLIYGVMFVSYYVFCYQFKHVCTENIRYAVPLIVIGVYFVGLAFQHLQADKKKTYKKVLSKCIFVITGIFCASSVLVYDIVSMYGLK
ncbi:MAG: ArnT family glycosyltransferase [Acutalibacteraceae bacterium]